MRTPGCGAGVIPFIALSPPIAAVLPLPADVVQHAALLQLGYGATILSFLGGVHWGIALVAETPGAFVTGIRILCIVAE
jgi:Protein of unknown function (DUF3429)